MGSFWIGVVFLFVIHSGMFVSCGSLLSCSFLLKIRIHAYYHGPAFSNLVVSWGLFLANPDISSSRGLFHFLSILFSVFSLCSFLLFPSTLKWFRFFIFLFFCFFCFLFVYLGGGVSFCLCLLICLYALSTNLLVEFFFAILECSVLLYHLTLSRSLLMSFFFRQYLFIYFFLVILSDL